MMMISWLMRIIFNDIDLIIIVIIDIFVDLIVIY